MLAIHRKATIVLLAGFLVLLASCQSYEPLPTVDEVDIKQYQGKWYEVARLPQIFEKDCACVTAEYAIRDDGNLDVVNTCLDTISNKIRVSDGRAFPQKGSNNSRLKVQFFFPFKGDYYVVALDKAYEYAMIGTPSRESLWILSRTPVLSENVERELISRAEQLGFETSNLIHTKQSCDEGELKM